MIYPSNPTVGEIINVGGTKKKWDGVKWVNITHGNHESRLQALEAFDSKQARRRTLAEAKAEESDAGTTYIISDRYNADCSSWQKLYLWRSRYTHSGCSYQHR